MSDTVLGFINLLTVAAVATVACLHYSRRVDRLTPDLGESHCVTPLPQRLTMVPKERQEARQVIGDGRLRVLRRRVQEYAFRSAS